MTNEEHSVVDSARDIAGKCLERDGTRFQEVEDSKIYCRIGCRNRHDAAFLGIDYCIAQSTDIEKQETQCLLAEKRTTLTNYMERKGVSATEANKALLDKKND